MQVLRAQVRVPYQKLEPSGGSEKNCSFRTGWLAQMLLRTDEGAIKDFNPVVAAKRRAALRDEYRRNNAIMDVGLSYS